MEDIQIYIYKVPVLIFIHISIHTIKNMIFYISAYKCFEQNSRLAEYQFLPNLGYQVYFVLGPES